MASFEALPRADIQVGAEDLASEATGPVGVEVERRAVCRDGRCAVVERGVDRRAEIHWCGPNILRRGPGRDPEVGATKSAWAVRRDEHLQAVAPDVGAAIRVRATHLAHEDTWTERAIFTDAARIDIRPSQLAGLPHKVECGRSGPIVLEVVRTAFANRCVDGAAQVHGRLPAQVIPCVLPTRYVQISAAAPTRAIAVEEEAVSVRRKTWRLVHANGVDVHSQVLGRSPCRVDACAL